MTSRGMDMIRTGDFNNMAQYWQADGSVIIDLVNRRTGESRRLHVDHYGQPDERVRSDEPLEIIDRRSLE